MSDLDIREFGPCNCPLHNRRTGEIMPHWRSLVESKYLSHFELQGRDVTVTIKSIKKSEIVGSGGKKSMKALFMFEGKQKGAVFGVTCMKSIASLYGDDVDGWIGKRITLYPSTTEASGETVGTIRVRNTAPRAVSAPASNQAGTLHPLAANVAREPGDEPEDRGDEPTAEEMANG